MTKKNQKNFKIIIFQNGKQHKMLKQYVRGADALTFYNEIKEKNREEIKIKKRKLNTDHGRIKAVLYELILLQRESDNVHPRTYKNEFGDWVSEKPINGWIIQQRCEWFEEEVYWVQTKRKYYDFNKIIDELIVPRFGYFVNISIFFNKIVIDDSEEIDIIQCKTEKDAFILYDELKNHLLNVRKVIGFLFSGYLNDENRRKIRPRLVELTKLNRQEFYRRASAKPEKY